MSSDGAVVLAWSTFTRGMVYLACFCVLFKNGSTDSVPSAIASSPTLQVLLEAWKRFSGQRSCNQAATVSRNTQALTNIVVFNHEYVYMYIYACICICICICIYIYMCVCANHLLSHSTKTEHVPPSKPISQPWVVA